jgi:hypothetical protein
LLANLNATVLDYAARQKVGGTSLKYFTMKQLPVIASTKFSNPGIDVPILDVHKWISSRVIELCNTALDIGGFADDCGYVGQSFRWIEDRRFLIRCELDAVYFHLYLPATEEGNWKPARKTEGALFDESAADLVRLMKHFPTPRHAVDFILDTFPIVRRKDESRFSEYRTKRVILELYDAMQESIRTGRPYVTRLDPPPGPPEEGLPEWKSGSPRPSNWSLHIHPPKDCRDKQTSS